MPWQPSPVVYPDVELVLTGYYRSALPAAGEANVYVSNTMPSTRRDRMVLIRRDGGTVAGTRDRTRVTLRVFATTEQGATDLARVVLALAPMAANGVSPVVHVVPQSGPLAVADDSGQPLRMIVSEFHTRGVAL